MAGSALCPSGNRLTGQEAADCDRGQGCDPQPNRPAGRAQTVVRGSNASEQGRNAELPGN